MPQPAPDKTIPNKNSCKKILVVEDDKDIAHLLSPHLKDLSYDVVITDDGEGGWRLAAGQRGRL